MNRLSESIIKYRWLILVATLIGFLALSVGAKKLIVSVSYEVFFGKDNPELLAYEELKKTYTNTDNLVYIVVPKNNNGIYQKDVLEAVYDLTEASWGLPYSNRVDSITNYQHTSVENDDLLVEYLVENKSDLSDEKIGKIRNVIEGEPTLLNNMAPDNGVATAVYVTFNLPNESPKEVEELIGKSEELIAAILEKHSNVEIKPIGLTMLSYTFGQAAKVDAKTLTPMMFLLIIAVMAIFLRSFAMVFSTVVVILFTVIASLGAIGWLGFKITTVTAAGPTIVIGLVVAQCIHILVGIRQEYKNGTNKNQAIIESLNKNIKPVFVTAMTTAIGFLVMNFNDVPPYRDLGNFMAIAIAISFMLSIFFMPALISIIPMMKVKKAEQNSFTSRMLMSFSEVIIRQPKKVIIFTIGVLLVSIYLIPKNILNEKFVEQFDESYQFRKDNDYYTDNVSGIYSIEYSIKKTQAKENDIFQLEYMQRLEEFTIWLRDLDEVRHVYSFSDTLKRINKNMHGDADLEYKLPETAQEIAQFILLYELSLPYGLDLNNQISMKKDATRVVVRFDDMASSEIIKFQEKVRNWWGQYSQEYIVTDASTTLMFTHITKRAIDSMGWGTVLAFLLIALILSYTLRDFKLGLLSLLPNIAPIIIGLGAWALINGEVGMSFAIVVALTLGIVVDDTVHFLSKYQYAKNDLNYSNEDAVRYTFGTVGVALWVTSIALVCGFLMLSTSGFARTADMGLLSSLIIILALVIDFLLLPALLLMRSEKEETDSEISIEEGSIVN